MLNTPDQSRAAYDDSPETFNYEGARRMFAAVLAAQFEDATATVPEALPLHPPADWVPKVRKGAKVMRPADHYRKARLAREKEINRVEADRVAARKWLVGRGPNFVEVCRCAGYEPGYVSRKVEELAARGWTKLVLKSAGTKMAA